MPLENPLLFDIQYSSFEGGPDSYTTKVSLRDLFAASALAGLAGNPRFGNTASIYARNAYVLADALLAERAEGAQ